MRRRHDGDDQNVYKEARWGKLWVERRVCIVEVEYGKLASTGSNRISQRHVFPLPLLILFLKCRSLLLRLLHTVAYLPPELAILSLFFP